MAIDIEETMSVKAPPKLVWNWLLNIENTIGALPGAKLESVSDDGRNFVARMKVKVGTVSLTYKGDLQLTEVDEAAQRVQISGKWKEVGGSGSATMELTGTVVPKDDGTTDVQFVGMADPVGRIVQFGKGMMQGVGAQLFSRFSKKASSRMEKEALEAEFSGDDAESVEAAQESAAAQQAADEAKAKAEAAKKAAEDAAAAAPAAGGEVDLSPVMAKIDAAMAAAESAQSRADAAYKKAEEALAKAESAAEMAQKAGQKVTELATAGADEQEEELNGIAVFFQWLFGGGKKKK